MSGVVPQLEQEKMENPNRVPDLTLPLPQHPNALPFTTTPYTVCRRNSLKTQGPKGKYWEDLLTTLGLDFRGTDAHKKIDLVAVARASGDLETSLRALEDCAEVQLYSLESQRLSKLCQLAAIEIAKWALDRFWQGGLLDGSQSVQKCLNVTIVRTSSLNSVHNYPPLKLLAPLDLKLR